MGITRKKILYAIAGIFLWLLFIYSVREASNGTKRYLAEKVQEKLKNSSAQDWFDSRGREIVYSLEPVDLEIVFDEKKYLKPGDKIYLVGDEREIQLIREEGVAVQKEIGIVLAINEEEEKLTKKWVVYIRMYPEYVRYVGANSTFYHVILPRDFGWMARKLFTEEKIDDSREKFKRLLQPELTALLKDSYWILQERMPEFLKQHKRDFHQHIKKINEQRQIDKDIEEIVKIVLPKLGQECQKEFQPIFDQMLKKFPKWKVAWAWVKDQMSDKETHVKTVLEQYIEEEVTPILENKENKQRLKSTILRVLDESAEDKKIQAIGNRIKNKIFEDEQFIEFLKSMIVEFYDGIKDELLVEVRQRWESPQFQYKLQYFLNEILRDVVWDESGEISEDFATLVRRLVFYKGRYCICMTSTWKPFKIGMASGERYCANIPSMGYPKRFAGKR